MVSHPEQLAWVERCVTKYGLAGASPVYEVGSLNVNGSPRSLFSGPRYYGFDIVPGRDVDIIAPDGFARMAPILLPAQVIVCCEVLEHDPNAEATVRAMVARLLPGGSLIITAAGPGRPEHGTRRTTGEVWGPDPDYYRNVTVDDLLRWTNGACWEVRECEAHTDPCDVFFYGTKLASRKPFSSFNH